MKYLYYCNSAYQLLNVLNLHWHRKYNQFENIDNYNADLIVLNSFKMAKELVTIIDDEGFFNNVVLVNRVDKSSRINNLINLLFPFFLLKKNIHNSNIYKRNNYDYICPSKFSWIAASIWQLNKKAKLSLHEDGVGAYSTNMNLMPNSKLYFCLYKTMNYNRGFEDYESIYINSKKLYCFADENKRIEIPKMSNEFLERINIIFKNAYDKKTNDIYFLSQFGEYSIKKPTLDYLYKFKNKVIFCPHPRYDSNDNYGFDVISDKNIWELYACNTPNFDDKCLIAVHSTAVFTPKILFNKEPSIILLYKLLDKPFNGLDGFVKKFIETYENKEKIMIPETLEELYRDIDNVIINISNK